MRIFKGILATSNDAYMTIQVCNSLKEFKEMCSGNGRLVDVEEITNKIRKDIPEIVSDFLKDSHLMEQEIEIVRRILRKVIGE